MRSVIKRDTKGNTHTHRKRPLEDECRDETDAATSQGMRVTPRNWKSKERNLVLEVPEGSQSCRNPDFKLLGSQAVRE